MKIRINRIPAFTDYWYTGSYGEYEFRIKDAEHEDLVVFWEGDQPENSVELESTIIEQFIKEH